MVAPVLTGTPNPSAPALCAAGAGEHTVTMTTTSPDPTPTRLPLRHRKTPINRAERPSSASVVSLVIVVVGYLISLVAPSLVVSPSAPSAPMTRVLAAFALTLLGVAVSVAAGLLAFRRTHNWGWLIITGVPAVSLVSGGAILAATKAMA